MLELPGDAQHVYYYIQVVGEETIEQTRNALLPAHKSYMHQPLFNKPNLLPCCTLLMPQRACYKQQTRKQSLNPRRFPYAVDEQCEGPEERRFWNV
jgi:hypothetical protein